MVQEDTPLVGVGEESNSAMTVGSSISMWRRWRWKLLGLPRNIFTNRKFMFLLGICIVLLVVYLLTASQQPISRHLHHFLKAQDIFGKTKDDVKLSIPRLTWRGGGGDEVDALKTITDAPTLIGSDPVVMKPIDSIGHPSSNKLYDAAHVLVLSRVKSSSLTRAITELLVSNKMKYSQETISGDGTISSLSDAIASNPSYPKFRCIVFEDFRLYLRLPIDTRSQLDGYLLRHKVGLVAFLPNSTTGVTRGSGKQEQLKGYPLLIHNKISVKEVRPIANNSLGLYRVVRPGNWGAYAEEARPPVVGLSGQHPALVPVEEAVLLPAQGGKEGEKTMTTVIVDTGGVDGIRRVVVGGGLTLWLRKLLFLDALAFTGGPRLAIPLNRFLLVDVDDIFVAKAGIRMKEADVKAMIEAQQRLRQRVPGFTFNLGFSGFYFLSGTAEENLGDKALVGNASSFWWFGHMWRHTQPHKLATTEDIRTQMLLNKHFAKTYNITVDSGYSVAPHHSGVYPVHEPLYEAWKRVWGVRATSTEEYPHLRPDRLRRGFVHRGIMVMPRQMCGLFTHTLTFDSPEHPDLKAKLDASINGGELFQTIVFNPISVFMTHMTNFANDRLALYVFEAVVRQVQLLTNLQLRTEPPLHMAQRYFSLYPDEANPLWGNPCLDKRHMEIWSGNKSCSSLPDFLVLGPQKTGTTALYTFLGLHPAIRHNIPSPHTFEEVQFFSGNNYFRGLDWYLKAFPVREAGQMMFEKSATYFDNEAAPGRVKALLPDAKLVVLLLPPERRAYSWYQHQASHGIPAAVDNTFSQVLRAADDSSAPKALVDLRARCLHPGEYSTHLRRWLDHFPSSQLYVIDGDRLRTDPVAVMGRLQHFLGVNLVVDYSDLIRFNPRKGFFCQVTAGGASTKCLGKSKGKKYPAMLPEDEEYLKKYFGPHNSELTQLLHDLGGSLPSWLQEEEASPDGEEAPGLVGEGF